MNVDREALLAAVSAANLVVDEKHSIDIFTKVWLLEDYIVGFNANGMVFRMQVEGLPSLGGVEGKVLEHVLNQASGDELEITSGSNGELTLADDESSITLSVIDLTDTVKQVSKIPEFNGTEFAELDCADLIEGCQIQAMLQLSMIAFDTSADFQSLVMDVSDTKAKLYTSDRVSINRTTGLEFGVVHSKMFGRRFLIPLEFVRVLMRLMIRFGSDAKLRLDHSNIVAESDGIQLAARLLSSDTNTDFEGACGRIWPKGKPDSKLMVPIPEALPALLKQAAAITRSMEDDKVKLTTTGEALIITGSGRGKNKFQAKIPCTHPPASVSVSCKRVLTSLPHANKMMLLSGALALKGKKRFWRFIAGRS